MDSSKHAKLLLLALASAMARCASPGVVLAPNNSAELTFSRQGALPGTFTELDGEPIPGRPVMIRVPAGKHTIEYTCPDVITMDVYPTVRAQFLPARGYALECGANEPGVVKAR